ncbi:MAG: hypothetical protein ACE5G5_13095 [Candidatus Methylomirabilales bacterium]
MAYYCSQSLYQAEDRIVAGNWGRVVLGIGPTHGRFFCEYLFEKVRALEFPNRPSRMEAAFAFESADFATNWRRGNAPEYVYAVHLADPNSLVHRGDMSWTDLIYRYRTFQGMEECARRYWRGEVRDQNQIELVVAGDLIVETRLTRIGEDGT